MSLLLRLLNACLVAGFLLTAPLPLFAGTVSPEGLELSSFTLKAPQSPQIGDKITVEFTLRNAGTTPIRFDPKFGAFVGARWFSKLGSKKLIRDFGFTYQGWKLKPGQSITIQAVKVLDMRGHWTFFPTYLVNGNWGPFENVSKSLAVGSSQAPLAGDARFNASAPDSSASESPKSVATGKISQPAASGSGKVSPPPPPAPAPMAAAAPGAVSANAGKSVVLYQGQNLPLQVFPQDNAWNQDISQLPVHPESDTFLGNIGKNTSLRADFGSGNRYVIFGHALKKSKPYGIPFVVVRNGTPTTPIDIEWKNESDRGPYYIPANAPIEGSGDRHVIALHYDQKKLYELFEATSVPGGFKAKQGTIWDLTTNKLRPWGWTSADAAGLPIFPGLVRYEEVYLLKEIRHALRFTVGKTRRAFILPATHWASSVKHPARPPMGLRVRLKANYDLEPFPEPVQIILRCLKKYGMILADNGGDFYISGAPHPKWDDDALDYLKKIKGKDLEVVFTGETITKIPTHHINNPVKKK